ncbi:MAG: putative toxin-antitoxin system toxin component, PIN family [Candidatus Accumulibacter sp. UW20]
MRIVLDTNVVLSALLWRGTPNHLLSAIGQRQDVQVYSSTALLEELADVLTRSSASKRLALIGKTAPEVLADYVEIIGVPPAKLQNTLNKAAGSLPRSNICTFS